MDQRWPNTKGVVKLAGKRFDPKHHTFIFTHVPKCGGTSVHRILAARFGDRYRHYRGVEGERENEEGLAGAGGHQVFGHNPLHQRGKGLVYMTVLRHPVDRFLSFYSHVQAHKDHYLWRTDPEIAGRPPLEFARGLEAAGNTEISNLQAKIVAPSAFDPQDAIEFVDHAYSIVGIMEHMDACAAEIYRILDEPPKAAPLANLGERSDIEVTPELRACIEELNEIDLALYQHFNGRYRRSRTLWRRVQNRARKMIATTRRDLVRSIARGR